MTFRNWNTQYSSTTYSVVFPVESKVKQGVIVSVVINWLQRAFGMFYFFIHKNIS